jgi:hypothetical protein
MGFGEQLQLNGEQIWFDGGSSYHRTAGTEEGRMVARVPVSE